MKAKEVAIGDVIVERTDRGRIISKVLVLQVVRCASEPVYMHFVVNNLSTSGFRGQKILCYYADAQVEVA